MSVGDLLDTVLGNLYAQITVATLVILFVGAATAAAIHPAVGLVAGAGVAVVWLMGAAYGRREVYRKVERGGG